jgi:VIT1/CCC1 family predicted Fe2+/Mn2+ transporter
VTEDFAAKLARHKREEHQIGRIQEFLKQIIYGGNDGIVTTFAVVAGFAGFGAEGAATLGGIAVLLFGLANLFADATAMGLGEFLSSRSEQDVYRATRASELHEIHSNPEFETAEVVEILSARGMDQADAASMAQTMTRNPEFMADFMMQYEIGMADPGGDAPAARGLMTFLSFIVFGTAPLLPYFVLDPVPSTFRVSVAATFAALAALGLLRWRVTSETVARCVGETVLVGGICASVAYLVGVLFRLA